MSEIDRPAVSASEKTPRPRHRVLFVEQFYFPEGWGGAELPLDLTVHLARSGFAVEVICGSDQYAPVAGETPPDPRAHGVRIRRIPSLLRGDIHRAKLLRQLWFYAALAPLLLLRRPPDIFISQTNPPLAVVVIAAAAWLWGKPLIIIAMDIYPEVLVAHGAASSRSVPTRILAALFGWAYRKATRIVALGPVMRERLREKGVSDERISEIPNWATGMPGRVDAAQNRLLQEWGLERSFVLLYSGNLGLAHEFDTLLEGVRDASGAVPGLRLIIIGRGSRLDEVRRRSEELGLGGIVRFSDPLPANRLPESFGLADLAVVTLRAGFAGLVVPSKLQGYMARALPILYIGPDSDIERFVRRSSGGICFREHDTAGLAAALRELSSRPGQLAELGSNARRFYECEFSKERGLAAYEGLVRTLLDAGRQP